MSVDTPRNGPKDLADGVDAGGAGGVGDIEGAGGTGSIEGLDPGAGEASSLSAPSDDDPRAAMTAVVAIVGALLIFVIVIALQAWFYNAEEGERVTKVYSRTSEEVARLRAGQRDQLNAYRWIDREQGSVSIPIGRAMELVVRENASPAGTAREDSDAGRSGSAAGAAPGGLGSEEGP